MTPAQTQEARREIAAALARATKPEVRSRLIAVGMVLSGKPIEDAAASVLVSRNTVKDWLRAMTYDGIARTLARWEGQRTRARPLDADPAALRELAATESNPAARKRLLALACVAEGMSAYDAEIKTGLSHTAIYQSIKRFRAGGASALQRNVPDGRRQKLTAAELQKLRTRILARPEMGYAQLRDLVATRFGACYTRPGLRALLSRLAIAWKEGRPLPRGRSRRQHAQRPRGASESVRPPSRARPHPATTPQAEAHRPHSTCPGLGAPEGRVPGGRLA